MTTAVQFTDYNGVELVPGQLAVANIYRPRGGTLLVHAVTVIKPEPWGEGIVKLRCNVPSCPDTVHSCRPRHLFVETQAERDARYERANRAEQVATLRALADFLEAGHGPKASYLTPGIHFWCAHRKDDVAELARDAARAGWTVEKVYEDGGKLKTLRVTPPGGFAMEMLGAGAACTAVVVGQETVEVTDWAAPQPEMPARPTKTVTQDKIEWRCDPILGD